jgi:hypothetical protein
MNQIISTLNLPQMSTQLFTTYTEAEISSKNNDPTQIVVNATLVQDKQTSASTLVIDIPDFFSQTD